ncbi:hypothetical protein PHA8399_00358 [Leisingera aquaemixtae]|uniref:Uncharacterized protein n=1 Tax=Leisingera aquaemixtae TaxID=1396826 RepID=A0A0P1H5S5_9RHOB|nr:hypothetical protein PHA8399_00358 [Leisingera aquaemixtae]
MMCQRAGNCLLRVLKTNLSGLFMMERFSKLGAKNLDFLQPNNSKAIPEVNISITIGF